MRTPADAGQLLAGQPVDDAAAAEARLHLHEVVRVVDHLADDRGVASERMRAHRREQALGVGGATDRDELALVGDVERIEPEELAGRARPARFTGMSLLVDHHAAARLPRDLVQRRREPAARRVAQAVDAGHRRQHRGHEAVQRRRIRRDRGLERQVLAQRHDRHAVVAHACR